MTKGFGRHHGYSSHFRTSKYSTVIIMHAYQGIPSFALSVSHSPIPTAGCKTIVLFFPCCSCVGVVWLAVLYSFFFPGLLGCDSSCCRFRMFCVKVLFQFSLALQRESPEILNCSCWYTRCAARILLDGCWLFLFYFLLFCFSGIYPHDSFVVQVHLLWSSSLIVFP